MKKILKLDPEKLTKIRDIDPRLISYNVEMTEVTGGTFWKPYTKEQIDGTEEFPVIKDIREMATKLMAYFEPLDLTNERLIALSAALGPAYVRVSGSWASKTYYDLDGHTKGEIPESFGAVLTKKQWQNVLDFVKAVDGKLLVSVANCEGVHNENGTWNPEQAKLLFDFSRDYGVPIDSAEFMNEPNTFGLDGAPKDYTVAAFSRDQDAFFRFLRDNYPGTSPVGPSAAGDDIMGNLGDMPLRLYPTADLLSGCKEKADVFSYHYYNDLSERGAALGLHWNADAALSEEYLSVAAATCRYYGKLRDENCPGAPMWVTESADAGCGGNTWGSTFLDVIRYADELGRFCTLTDGIIFHNTLTSSDYGLLDHHTHEPRPNYWLAYLWRTLVGSRVYDTHEEIREGVHFYAHSRKDGEKGYTYVLINNSKTESTEVNIPVDSMKYTLSAETLRSSKVLLNGAPLEQSGVTIPEIKPEHKGAGNLQLAPVTVTFLIVKS